MRKKTITTLLLICVVSMYSYAQILESSKTASKFYIGGSLGFNTSLDKIKDLDNSAVPSYSISVSPEIGYSLNEKTNIGLSFSILFSSSKQSTLGFDDEGDIRAGGTSESKSRNLEIAPYIRYSLLKWGKLSLMGIADIYINVGKTESESLYEYESEHVSIWRYSEDGYESFTWGIRVRPQLIYNLSNKISLLVNPNLFRLGFYQNRYKTEYNLDGDEYTRITTGLDFKIDTNNLLPSVGFIYKF